MLSEFFIPGGGSFILILFCCNATRQNVSDLFISRQQSVNLEKSKKYKCGVYLCGVRIRNLVLKNS